MIKQKYISLYFKGIAMGAADIVPGVSGGTIAFISGIYETLVTAIANVSISLPLLRQPAGVKRFWTAINGKFLLVLGLGIASSLISLAHVVSYLLRAFPELVFAFFFGLIIASSISMLRSITQWNSRNVALLIGGMAAAYALTLLPPGEIGSESLLVIFASGFVSICAMILPGISGAFVLLLIGMYEPMLHALKTLAFGEIAVFLCGCGLGLLSFSRLLAAMLRRFANESLCLLLGCMIGALNKVWPWQLKEAAASLPKAELSTFFGQNVSPFTYHELTQQDPMLLASVLLMLGAIGGIVALERCGARKAELPCQHH